MLILTRCRGEAIRLLPHPGLNPATPIGELFKNGPIRIVIVDIGPNRMQIGIEANPGFTVIRDELSPRK